MVWIFLLKCDFDVASSAGDQAITEITKDRQQPSQVKSDLRFQVGEGDDVVHLFHHDAHVQELAVAAKSPDDKLDGAGGNDVRIAHEHRRVGPGSKCESREDAAHLVVEIDAGVALKATVALAAKGNGAGIDLVEQGGAAERAHLREGDAQPQAAHIDRRRIGQQALKSPEFAHGDLTGHRVIYRHSSP
jgi:hypothetical protein